MVSVRSRHLVDDVELLILDRGNVVAMGIVVHRLNHSILAREFMRESRLVRLLFNDFLVDLEDNLSLARRRGTCLDLILTRPAFLVLLTSCPQRISQLCLG